MRIHGLDRLPIPVAAYAPPTGGAYKVGRMTPTPRPSMARCWRRRSTSMRAWFWLSPILYPNSVVPEEWRNLYYLNPMVVVIEGTRWAFTQTPMPPLEAWLIGAASAGLMLVGGFIVFRNREPVFSDLM